MKNLLILIFLIEVLTSSSIYSQWVKYEGLEFFNPYMQNPAFIVAEKTVQFDFIGSTEWTKFSEFPWEFSINSINTIDKINSSFRISFDYNTLGGVSARNLIFGYSYNHSISEDFVLKAGISINPDKFKYDIDFEYDPDYDLSEFNSFEYKSSNLDLGLGAKYKNLSIGFSARQKLFGAFYTTDQYGNDSSYAVKGEFSKMSSTIKYDFSIAKKFTLSPQLNMDFYHDGFSDEYNLRLYPGFIANYNNIFGAGLVYSAGTILIGSVSFSNTIRLYLVLYKDKTILYDKDTGWDLTGQLRINF